MTSEVAIQILLDSLKDSAIAFAFVFVCHIIISLFEDKLAQSLTRKKVLGPLFGSLVGQIPQCGTSVLGADLYLKKYITLGTLCAIFISCNDEALIVLITESPSKPWFVIPLLILIKFVVGFLMGMGLDLIFNKQKIEDVHENLKDVTCEDHHHENTRLHKHFLHPLVHSLEIFLYVFIATALLNYIIAGVGQEAFTSFLTRNQYLSPLFSCIVGLIPNCAGSVLLATLFNSGTIPFGALVGGLIVNSGLGILMLFKSKKTLKSGFTVLGICFLTGVIISYLVCLIMGFGGI